MVWKGLTKAGWWVSAVVFTPSARPGAGARVVLDMACRFMHNFIWLQVVPCMSNER